MEHVKFLASDELAGRGNGTQGLDRAGQYIADQLRTAGVRPAMNGSWFQPFQIVTGLEVREGNKLTITGKERATTFQLGRTYLPLSVVTDAAASSAS